MEDAAAIVRRLRDGLQLDDGWTLEDGAALTWWGHRLAQRIWVDPPLGGVQRVHLSTDLLSGVPAGEATAERLSALNRFAILSAMIWEPASGELVLHATAALRPDNLRWLEPLLLCAVTLQAARAHASADAWAAQLGGRVAESQHPEAGVRKAPAERLEAQSAVFGRLGADVSPFTAADMEAVLRMDPAPWSAAEPAGIGLRAALATDDALEIPAATLTVSAETRHPQVGSGVHLALGQRLPPGTSAAAAAVALNAAEVQEPAECHLLGAWCAAGDDEVAFVTFLPAAVYEPGLLPLLCWTAGQRARWARAYVTGRDLRLPGGPVHIPG